MKRIFRLEYGEFMTLEGLQMTEIFEYALSLSRSNSTLCSFQPLKFTYATWLLDHGLCQQECF